MFELANCAAVIPCFNEAGAIAALVPAVRRQIAQVWVVDDGSTDATGALARRAGAAVLRHPRNLGKGAALRSGLSRALDRGLTWAVTLDGDAQHAPEDLPALFRCARDTDARLVIGNRMGQAGKMPWLRRQANRWMSWQLSLQARRRLPDTQSGFRLIHLETWATLSLAAERFEVESETLMAFLAAGQPVEFVDVRVLPSRRRSHICPVADTFRWVKWWRRYRRTMVDRAGT
jgi:glycosyltransferase involved in cell wall biosynthesis